MFSFFVCAIGLGLLLQTKAYKYKFGSCAEIPSVPNFQISKFLGKWYVIQETDASSFCKTNTVSRGKELGEYLLTSVSQVPLLGFINFRRISNYSGQLAAQPGVQRGRFNLTYHLMGTQNYTIFDTDYETFAATYSCQKFLLGHRESVAILSRSNGLSTSIIDKVILHLIHAKIDFNQLLEERQDDCFEMERKASRLVFLVPTNKSL